jgi:hypothetical protein
MLIAVSLLSLVAALFFLSRARRSRLLRTPDHIAELGRALGKVVDEAAAAERVHIKFDELVVGRDPCAAVTSRGVVLAHCIDRDGSRFRHALVIGGVSYPDARFVLATFVVLLSSRVGRLEFTTRRAGAGWAVDFELDAADHRALTDARIDVPAGNTAATLDSAVAYDSFLSGCALFRRAA